MLNVTYFQNARPEMAGFLPDAYLKVLEIGCGKGGFRKNVKHDCEYWGVEPSSQAAVVAAKCLDKVVHGTYEMAAAELPAQYFDLIICNDVIEHMPDHDNFFQMIKKKIRPGGYIVGSVPNVRYIFNLIDLLFRKEWEYQEGGGILDNTHLRFFTEKSLKSILANNGYKLEEFKGINPTKIGIFPVKRFFLSALMFLAGTDSRYMQFGFRVQLPKGAPISGA